MAENDKKLNVIKKNTININEIDKNNMPIKERFGIEVKNNNKLPKILIDFLSYLETIKGKSYNTIEAYKIDLSLLFKYLKVYKGYPIPDDIEFEEIPINDLQENFIKDIHERTTLDCQPRIRGTYRIAPVYIQGSLTEPVDPIQIRELMPTLLYAYENSDAHPIAKAAAFHAMFENIHPFQDGNGRTGRLILNYMLEKEGYPPIALKHDAKQDYKKSLEEWQVRGNPKMFLDVVKNYVLDELQERIRIITVTRETMKVLNMDLKYENSEKPMELDDDLEI